MPKRKKYPRLPNAFGSIRYLGKGRSLPYAVHPPATDRNIKGDYIRPKAICYVPDWYTGFAVLSAYHAGTYTPGLELTIRKETEQSNYDLDLFCRRVLRDHAMSIGADPDQTPTFKEVYEMFITWKFGESATAEYSDSAKAAYKNGFKWMSVLHDKPIDKISVEDLQTVVNDCPKKKATRENMVLTAKQIYKYAVPRHICTDNPAQYVVVPSGRDDESGTPFTTGDLRILWKNRSDPTAEMILIMCYSGFRISAYKTMEVNTAEKYFKGGVKTRAGKNRIVPIHSVILPLVQNRLVRDGQLLVATTGQLRSDMDTLLSDLGIPGDPKHTPHDCRHTFSALCESHGVSDADRKRMMGHSFGGDLTNGVYGHRTLEELRASIEKIPAPSDL